MIGRIRLLADSKQAIEKHSAAQPEYDRLAALISPGAPEILRRKYVAGASYRFNENPAY